jgi:adenylate cyclase
LKSTLPMSNVFVSYARSSEPVAKQIVELLRSAGHAVWRDDQLPAHKPFAEVIEAQLRAAKAVVVIWSAEALKSQWVRAEADLAFGAGTLVQVSVDGTIPPLPFNQIQCTQLIDWTGVADAPGWRNVLDSIEELDRRVETDAPPVTPDQRAVRSMGPATTSAPPASRKPLVLVPVFTDLSPADAKDFLAEGLREDIVAALSRHTNLSVRSDEMGFGQSANGYRLEAQVRRASGKVRVSARLIKAAGGEAIWSERYDGSDDSVFELQDEIALGVAANVEAAIRREQISSAPPATDAGATAEVYYLNALRNINLSEKKGYFDALPLLDMALALEPENAQVLASMALAHANIWMIGYDESGEHNRAAGIAAAQQALRITDSDSFATGLAAVSLAYLGEPIDVPRGLIDRILSLNPSYAVAWLWSGTIRLMAGDLDVCITHLETALRLDTRTSVRPLILSYIGAAHVLALRHDTASLALHEAHRLRPQLPWAALFLGASLGHAGRITEARELLAQCGTLENPGRYRFPLHNPRHRQFLAEGLQRASAGA